MPNLKEQKTAERPPRFDFMRSVRDPAAENPSFMADLKLRYPGYDVVWDTWKERWLCFSRLSESEWKAVAYSEMSDGTAGELCQQWLDKISVSDWARDFATPESFIQKMESDERTGVEAREARVREEFALVRKSLRGWVELNRESVQVLCKPFDSGWRSDVEKHFPTTKPRQEVST